MMKGPILKVSSKIMFVLLLTVVSVGAQAPASPDSEIEEEAMSKLKRMADFLSETQRFSVTTEIGYDAVQESGGQKIEFGSTRNMTVVRPDRARIDVTDRNGSKSGFVFNGKEIAAFNTDQNVYATAAKPGTLDEAVDYFTQELDMVLPLAQLISSTLPQKLNDIVSSIRYVDESIVGGVSCDHLAARNDKADFQIWIARGEKPLPQRVVITYKNEVGQPQFWAQFSGWNLSPKVSDSYFAFTPPAGAEKIPFAPWKPASAVEEKTVEGGEK